MSANLLASIPFFASLPISELDRLLSELEVTHLKSGEILFHEGDVAEHLYVIVSGELEILIGPGQQNELIMNLIHEGEYIGETSLFLSDGHRITSARAHRMWC
jgi:CRP-like cAMP-binding protein